MSPAAILILLSVLCHLHSGLLAASQTLQNCPILRANSNTFADLKAYGKSLRDCGRLSEATVVFRETVQQARESNNKKNEADALMLLGSAEILNFQYRAALTSYQTGRDIAEIIHNDSLTARASGSIATIYIQLGDFAAAEGESQRAISLLKRLTNPDAEDGRRLQRALVNHATVCFELKKDAQGYRDYDQGLTMATNDQERAYILNERGVALMRGNRLEEASATFQNTMELCRRSRDVSGLVAIEDEHLAELELRKTNPDFNTALSFIDKAFAEHSPIFDASPQYYPIHIRAKILLGLGRKSNALAEFMRAVNAANQWRLGALPGDATSTQTVANLQQVYSDYAQLAAEISLERGDKALAFNALEVLAENRATSLREQLAAAFGSNGSLPAEYYSKIAELQIAQAAVTLGRNTSEDQAKLLQIQLELSNLENKIGINSVKPQILREKIPRRNSLRDIQHALSGDQVLLSITLGKSRSYMWAVTAGNVNLLKLPGEGEITSKAELFASAVRLGQDISASSAAMSRALFSGLPPDVWNRSDWMMVADGPLLTGIPFSALQSLAPGHTGRPLIERTTLRFLPSELLIANRKKTKLAQTFVGVGDPIYNQADPRLNGLRLADAKTVSNGVTLARLVGSDKELRSAVKQAMPGSSILLTGAMASREELSAALSHGVGILHFAVHVVSPPDQPQQAALALSLKNGVPELLTSEAIASLRVPGSLVVLSGCSSGQGKILPGAGLVGLGRAWLIAGASAVVVSNWPTPDDSGRFFSSFYDHFDHILSGDTAQRAALALRQTQLDMFHGTGYQTAPSFWGAFAVIAQE